MPQLMRAPKKLSKPNLKGLKIWKECYCRLALVPVALFAKRSAETNYDIVQRTVNFIIFAAILWGFTLLIKLKHFSIDLYLFKAELW